MKTRTCLHLHQWYRAANHYVLAVVCYAQGHCTTLLRSWSYHDTLLRKRRSLFSIPCVRVGIKFASNQLHMCLFYVWDAICAIASWRSRFNQLTNRSVWFNSRTYASLPGETTTVFNHFKSPCWSEKLKASSGVMNLTQKMHTKISGKSMIQNSFCALFNQRRAPSMWSAVPASSVLGGMYDVEQRVNLEHHINKEKVMGSPLKIAH